MKVILVNGSPHEKGTTRAGLDEVKKALEADGVETEIFWIGKKPLSGCMGCGGCAKTGRCVIDDAVNVFLGKAETADGFVFGSPVHFASASGAITSFMDRAFCGRSNLFSYKPAAAIVACRRAGGTATFDMLNKYFTITSMPVASSTYWNEIHGRNAADAAKDEEGMQTMRSLGHNMAWLLKCIEAGRREGVLPVTERKVYTDFVR